MHVLEAIFLGSKLELNLFYEFVCIFSGDNDFIKSPFFRTSLDTLRNPLAEDHCITLLARHREPLSSASHHQTPSPIHIHTLLQWVHDPRQVRDQLLRQGVESTVRLHRKDHQPRRTFLANVVLADLKFSAAHEPSTASNSH